MIPLSVPAFILSSPLLAGLISTCIFGRKAAVEGIPGLLFHSVVPVPGRELSHYPLDRFDAFCRELSDSTYRTICVKDASTGQHPAEGLSGLSPLLLTFDDGLDSVFHHALPVLETYGLKATVFCLGSHFGELSAWDIFTGNRHLTREQIRILVHKGIEIGSHTVTHPCLPYLDMQSIRKELTESKKTLEDITGYAVTSLAFPYGAWDKTIWQIALESGYTAATLYRGSPGTIPNLFPVSGVYRFDSPADILEKLKNTRLFSSVVARTRMMPHFAKGTPIWRYRKTYSRV